jgi:two-component system CheB/CheR fusion protein
MTLVSNRATERNPEFEALLDYIKHNRGFDFTGYKRPSLMRRISKRMQLMGLDHFASYQDYLEVHPEEFTLLFNTILINVTYFFRDSPAWDYLAAHIIPQILTGKKPGEPIRVWSAGCASGEEAYSIAILLAEALGTEEFTQRVKIYATDVDEEALAQARQAIYPDRAIEEVPEAFRLKYFEPVTSGYVFRNDLRRSIIFGRHDLGQDAPISRLDLLVCRNTLMYFNAEAQGRILARFRFGLNPTGFLFLGKAEMLLTHTHLFIPVDIKYRIFTKVSRLNLRDRRLIMAQGSEDNGEDLLVQQLRLKDAVFDSGPVAHLGIDIKGNLVLVNARARVLLGLELGELPVPLQNLELCYRPLELRPRIEQAYAELQPIHVGSVPRQLPDGAVQYLDVHITPLQDIAGKLLGIGVSYTDVTHYRRLEEELQCANQALETTNEELQSTNEELETMNEELQSTNEELETTNEELQSTNEELETMNEELQSTNEELETLNEEQRQLVVKLNNANAFLESVLASMRTAVVVVDQDLCILSWNRKAEDLWGMRVDEVVGQPLMGLDIGLAVDQLKLPLRNILSGEKEYQERVLDAINRRGKDFKCQVNCSPLLKASNECQGVILLMKEVIGNEP